VAAQPRRPPLVHSRRPAARLGSKPVAQPDIRVEPEEFIAAEGDKVIVPSQLVVRGTGSEIAFVGPSGTSLVLMPYTSAEARQELLEALAGAIDRIGSALAALGSAYEQLDEHNADRLEAELFGPIQIAYGRAKATYTQFAGRHGLVSRTFAAPSPGLPSIGAKGFIDSAVDAVAEADNALSTLQDSSLPTEVGDEELRAAITETRERLGGVRRRARELERTLGR
jgi:hypothetical protein